MHRCTQWMPAQWLPAQWLSAEWLIGHHAQRAARRLLLTLTVVASVIAPVIIPATPVQAQDIASAAVARVASPIPTDLTVTITNSQSTVRTAQSVDYAVVVTNGDAAVAMVGTLVITVPSFAEVTAGGGSAKSTDHGATLLTWPLEVKGGTQFKSVFTVAFGEIPATTFRVSMLANVFVEGSTTPVIGTADSDGIFGRTDPKSSAGSAGQDDSAGGVASVPFAAFALPIAVFLGALAATFVTLALRLYGRRRNRGRGLGRPGQNRHSVHGRSNRMRAE